MKNIKTISKPLFYLPLLFLCIAASAQKTFKPDKILLKTITQNFTDADKQCRVLMQNIPSGKLPKTYFPTTGKYEFSGPEWWCSGFYIGTLLNTYEQTKDTVLKNEAIELLGVLQKEQFNKNTHDLGFMMYCSFGNAYRLDPKPAYKTILINSAKSLATRFNPTVGCIRSWESKPETNDYIVIIDNMMNLELLFWATKATGDSSFYKIAVTHANTTMKNHFRPDYSSYHVINYDATTGAVKQKKTAQGAANESAWARGQAWGLYGYTVMFRETKDERYLAQANHIANFILTNPNFTADKIPYWDYNAPGIPNALKDASAASVMASAFIELSGYVNASLEKKYLTVAETILRSLSNPTYKASIGTNGGFIIQHSVGHLPQKTEVDVPLSYADYYFVEAMRRYKKL